MGFHCFLYSIFCIISIFLGFLVPSFISLFFLNTLFAQANLSWLIYEPIKALGIKTLILFNLIFANNTTYHALFLYSLLWTFIFLNHTAEFTIPTVVSTNKANAEIATNPPIAKTKTRECLKEFKALHFFLYISLTKSLCFILLKDNFLFHLLFLI